MMIEYHCDTLVAENWQKILVMGYETSLGRGLSAKEVMQRQCKLEEDEWLGLK